MYIGADKATSNTGEISAVIEAILWILVGMHGGGQLAEDLSGTQICIYTDSRYVFNLLSGKMAPKENLLICYLALHLWNLVKSRENLDIHVFWIPGHSGLPGNELADSLAKGGRQQTMANTVTREFEVDWDAWKFKQSLRALPFAFNHIPTLKGRVARFRSQEQDAPIHLGDDLDDLEPASFLHEGITISSVSNAITAASRLSGKGRSHNQVFLPKDDEMVVMLDKLVKLRRACKDPVYRQKISFAIFRARFLVRQAKAELEAKEALKYGRAPRRNRKVNKVFALRDLDHPEIIYDDPEEILDQIVNFYSKLYNGIAEPELPSWVFESWPDEELSYLPCLNNVVLKMLISEFANGKTGARDNIVSEMLAKIPDDILDIIVELFRLRILGRSHTKDTEDVDEAWDECVANLIEKVAVPLNISQFRSLALIPVLAKLYSKVLLYLAKPSLTPLGHCQFAFRKNHQAHEVVFILRSLIEKSIEWQIPIWVLDGDIKKAYDFARHSVILKALLSHRCPRILAAAMIREQRRMKVVLKLADQETEPISRNRALLQGDPSAPTVFNYTIDDLLTVFQAEAQRRQWGIKLASHSGKTYYLAILCFADNYWLLSTSPTELRSMSVKWLQILRTHGWDTPVDELTFARLPRTTNAGSRLSSMARKSKEFPEKRVSKFLARISLSITGLT